MSGKNTVTLKYSQPIRLQHYLIINIFSRNQLVPQIFCLEIIIKGRQDLRLILLVECGQLCLSSSQITGFFDHCYILKQSSYIVVFYMELVIKQRQNSRLLLLIRYVQVSLLSNQIAGLFFGHHYLQKESIDILFFYMDFVIKQKLHLRLLLLIRCGHL